MKNLFRTLTLAGLMTALAPASILNLVSQPAQYGAGVRMDIMSNSTDLWAGAFVGNVNGGSNFLLYCLDYFVSIGTGQWQVNILEPQGREERAGWLVENAGSMLNAPSSYAALQLAVWDIIHDGGDGSTAGFFRANSQTDAQIVSTWDTMVRSSANGTSQQAMIFENIGGRNMAQTLIGVPPVTGGEVPEPGTLVMIGLGMVGAAVLKRRK
jgi:hypothetical protein